MSTQKQPTNCTNSTNSSISEIREISEPSPKISVIVPVYKVEKYLPECIESVLAQTFTDFELILVDDGSPDNCGAICDAYAARDPRIRVFHKQNGGVSSARNLGLDHARGEWIAFVDSDDSVGEKYLEHLWGEGPAAGTLIFSGFTYLDEKGRETRRLQFAAGTRPVREAFREEQLYRYGYPFSKLYDACLVARERLRFDPLISLAEDWLFMMEYFCLIEKIETRGYASDYRYRLSVGGLSRKSPPHESVFQLFLKQREILKKLNVAEKDAWRSAKGNFFGSLRAIYRPPFHSMQSRLAKLKNAHSVLCVNEFSTYSLSFLERIFLRKHFLIFDFLNISICRMRYALPERVIRLINRLK